MNIPNDRGGLWRLDKFVEYYDAKHNHNDSDVYNLNCFSSSSLEDQAWISFLYSTCYCVSTTLLLHVFFPTIESATKESLEDFWIRYKDDLIFQSDRRYVKNNNKFCAIVLSYKEHLNGRSQEELVQEWNWDDDAIYKWFTKLYYCGRFSAMLFIEALFGLANKELVKEISSLDWNACKTCSQGLLVIARQDDLAKAVEKRDFTADEIPVLQSYLAYVVKYTQDHLPYPINFNRIIGYLCSYYKLYKQTRYLSYYTDRRLEELLHYKQVLPQLNGLWDRLFEVRYENVPHEILGELNGWTGIRKEKCKEFVTYGTIS